MTQTIVIHELQEAHRFVNRLRQTGRRVGLVPTMGALHEGHLSLVRAARRECDDVVATIFVNPTQFGPEEDFERYPRTWDADLRSLQEQGTTMVFAPSAASMYPPGSTTCVQPPAVAATLEGEHRPNHFRGVATVVLKLFQILPADLAFFGEKDFQQCLVIRDMVRDLNVPLGLRFCPIVREPDGLALSSRNKYLSAEQRIQARALSLALQRVGQLVNQGEQRGRVLEEAAVECLHGAGVDRIDYVALRDPDTLHVLTQLEQTGVMLIAAYVGKTRLIDNCRLGRTTADAPPS